MGISIYSPGCLCGQRVSFSEERGESEGGQIPGASAEKRMQRTSVDLMGETRKPDPGESTVASGTYIRGDATAGRRCHPEDNRDRGRGSQVGIAKHRIQYGQILLLDEADRIKGGFPEKKQMKCRFFQSRILEKEKSKR